MGGHGGVLLGTASLKSFVSGTEVTIAGGFLGDLDTSEGLMSLVDPKLGTCYILSVRKNKTKKDTLYAGFLNKLQTLHSEDLNRSMIANISLMA